MMRLQKLNMSNDQKLILSFFRFLFSLINVRDGKCFFVHRDLTWAKRIPSYGFKI